MYEIDPSVEDELYCDAPGTCLEEDDDGECIKLCLL